MSTDGMDELRGQIIAELREMFGAEPTDDMCRVALGSAYPLVFPERAGEVAYRRALRCLQDGARRAAGS